MGLHPLGSFFWVIFSVRNNSSSPQNQFDVETFFFCLHIVKDESFGMAKDLSKFPLHTGTL